MKLRRLTSKYLLKRAMDGVLPRRSCSDRRWEFAAHRPLVSQDLRTRAGDVLLDARARQRGYFRPDVVALRR